MFSVLVLFFGRLLQENLLIEVRYNFYHICIIFLDISGLQVSIEVVNNDLRPTIPKKTPENFAKLIRKSWVIFNIYSSSRKF